MADSLVGNLMPERGNDTGERQGGTEMEMQRVWAVYFGTGTTEK